MALSHSQSFKAILAKLVTTPEYFSPVDLTHALNHVFNLVVVGDNDKDISHVQIGAFLTALHLHRIDRRPDMLAAAADVLRARALKANVEAWHQDFVVDIVGTGGDGHNTFNVSTTAAIVAAGAGARVCKHGSRAATSKSGSADLLESLGCVFTQPRTDASTTPTHIARIPFTFILAPHFHPSLAHIAPLRKALPFRTMFNILGPLINPARPRGMVVGVAQRDLGATFARSLRDGGVERALVVCGAEGLDEISCAGDTWAWELRGDGAITERTLHPSQFGLATHPLAAVAGGEPHENAATFAALLGTGGEHQIPAALGPVCDFVLLNASALLVVAGVAEDFKKGVEMARASITTGHAWEALQTFKREGQRVAAAAAADSLTS